MSAAEPDGQDRSESLDGDALGEAVADEERPGVIGFPPERSMGSEDPSLFEDDDLDTRRARHQVTALDEAARLVEALVDTAPEGALDHEPALIADTADRIDPASAEEAAMHVEPEPGDTGEPTR